MRYVTVTYGSATGETMTTKQSRNGHKQRDLAGLIDLYVLRCQVEGKSPRTVSAYAETLRRFARIGGEEGFPKGRGRHRERPPLRLPRPLHQPLDGDAPPLLPRGALLLQLARRRRATWRRRRSARCATSACHSGSCSRSRQPRWPGSWLAATRRATSEPETRRSSSPSWTPASAAPNSCSSTSKTLTWPRAAAGPARQGEQAAGGALRLALPGGARRLPAVPGQRARPALSRRRLPPRDADGRGLEVERPQADAAAPGPQTGMPKVHAHRFRHTFATWAIEHDARELDVQYLLGHSSPDMVRRYASTYNCEQAARRHVASPARASWQPAEQRESALASCWRRTP